MMKRDALIKQLTELAEQVMGNDLEIQLSDKSLSHIINIYGSGFFCTLNARVRINNDVPYGVIEVKGR